MGGLQSAILPPVVSYLKPINALPVMSIKNDRLLADTEIGSCVTYGPRNPTLVRPDEGCHPTQALLSSQERDVAGGLYDLFQGASPATWRPATRPVTTHSAMLPPDR